MSKSYKEAGVDIEKGDRFAGFIGSIQSKAVSRSIGGFAGGVEIDPHRYKNPLLFSCTDGVGTKLLVAQRVKKYDTLGIDLVAMSVNDLIVCGVEPLSFLDYIACGTLDEKLMQEVISGVVKGCEEAECVLAGGETAEMPDLYGKDDFDLAGFCVGVADKSEVLPHKDLIQVGDVILGIPSTGIHSNGLSLARKVLEGESDEVWRQLLTPTKIYVKEMKALLKSGAVKAAAHITGGGLESNFARVMPNALHATFFWDWEIPGIFKLIQEKGPVETDEMRKVFNMGIGIAFVVSANQVDSMEAIGKAGGFEILTIGTILDKRD